MCLSKHQTYNFKARGTPFDCRRRTFRFFHPVTSLLSSHLKGLVGMLLRFQEWNQIAWVCLDCPVAFLLLPNLLTSDTLAILDPNCIARFTRPLHWWTPILLAINLKINLSPFYHFSNKNCEQTQISSTENILQNHLLTFSLRLCHVAKFRHV